MAVVRGVLLLLVFVCSMNALSYHETVSVSQPSVLDLLSTAVQDVTPCMLPCLLKNITDTYQTLLPCTNQIMTDVIQFIVNNDIKDYDDFYNKATAKTDGQLSPFCRFYDKSTACLGDAVTKLCGNGTAAHLQSLHRGIRAYANCEGGLLPVLQCAVHPDMFHPMAGYMECVGKLVQEVNERYLEAGMFNWHYFYDYAILANKGIGFKRLLTNFGSCLDTEITFITGCGRMRGYVLPQIEAIRNFLDVNHPNGTDALTCFGKPVVHIVYERCTERLIVDLATPPSPLIKTQPEKLREHLGDGTLLTKAAQLFKEHLSNGTLDELWQEFLLQTRPFYLSYSACLKSVTEQHCGYHWSTQEVIKINKPTDDFFMGLRPAVKGPDCGPVEGPPVEPSGGARHVPVWYLYMAVMMIVYVTMNIWSTSVL